MEYINMTIKRQKNIALIAHDGKKQDMIQWCYDNKEILKNHRLSGTGTTARMITDKVGLRVKGYNSGPLGGDQQIGAKIVEGSIDMVIFFSDPLAAQPHDPDVKALLRIAQVYDIPIAMITEQYMEYVNQMDKEDLNVVSEFLVMAATLLDIKSKMLLPKEVNEEGVEEDPRAELVEKLLEYKLFKYMSYELKDRQIDAERAFYKEPTVPKEVAAYRPPVNLEELIGDLTLHRLNQIFQDVLKRQEEKIDPIRSKFGKIEKEEVSMSEKLVQVRSYLKEHKQFSFRQMLSKNSSKVSVIVTFLVILELIKTGFVTVQQENTMADIEITVVKDPDLIEDIEEE